MSRPSKLTTNQCLAAITLRGADPKRWTVTKVAKKYHISEASMYKVLNGTYTPRGTKHNEMTQTNTGTPSLFKDSAMVPPNDVLLAAAQVIISRSKFANMLRSI